MRHFDLSVTALYQGVVESSGGFQEVGFHSDSNVVKIGLIQV